MNLALSLIHCKVHYKEPARNKKMLLELITHAAKNGANIIMTPEMAVSGYSFSSRYDIAENVEDEDGLFLQRVQEIATSFGCYICISLALREKSTDAYHNSATIFGPRKFFLRYNKINGEIRWAKPGTSQQTNYFDTPWGKIGILICSDTYYDLLPRITALKGVNLLLVPANWPPSGLDPIELWRVRALENGMAIAACNRTGQDLNMSCEQAESCLISADGEVLFRHKSSESTTFDVTLPLFNGHLPATSRLERLSNRYPEHYHSCYRNLSTIGELTSFLELPAPGMLSIQCIIPKAGDKTFDRFDDFFTKTHGNSIPSLWILPTEHYTDNDLKSFTHLSREYGIWIFLQNNTTKATWHLFTPGSEDSRQWPVAVHQDGNKPALPQIDIGPARVALMSLPDLRHPENAIASSKDGCDLIVVYGEHFTEENKLICGARTINHIAVAFCAGDGAGIWMRPEGHQRWGETITGEAGSCSFTLDTRLTRKKRFQDRVDFNQLFNK